MILPDKAHLNVVYDPKSEDILLELKSGQAISANQRFYMSLGGVEGAIALRKFLDEAISSYANR